MREGRVGIVGLGRSPGRGLGRRCWGGGGGGGGERRLRWWSEIGWW